MIVRDTLEELKEVTGTCEEAVILRAATRGLEMLANEGLFDPQIGLVEFAVDGGYLVSLPRDLKAIIKLNINNNPTFARSRLFEFMLNTEGSQGGEEVGWAWHNRGYSPLHDSRPLPGTLAYKASNAADNGLELTIHGLTIDGLEASETLTASTGTPTPSTNTYREITRVSRAATSYATTLLVGARTVARYAPEETEPEYRVIKLAKTAVSLRMLYRRHVSPLTSLEDFVPIHSPMAFIKATEAARMELLKQPDAAKILMERAKEFAVKEQAARDESDSAAAATEAQTALNFNITTRDAVIVGDFYDDAAAIFGPIGRAKLFDKITLALEALNNKGQWDSLCGWVDLVKAENITEVNPGSSKRGNGYFVLPRFVGTVLALNFDGRVGFPRNKWFEYHVNGTGERLVSSYGTWDDCGETPIVNRLPLDPETRLPVGSYLGLLTDDPQEQCQVRVFGYDLDGHWIRVAGQDGILLTANLSLSGSMNIAAPKIARIERVEKTVGQSFVRLVTVTASAGSMTDATSFANYTSPLAGGPTPNNNASTLALDGEWITRGPLTAYLSFLGGVSDDIRGSVATWQAYDQNEKLLAEGMVSSRDSIHLLDLPGLGRASLTNLPASLFLSGKVSNLALSILTSDTRTFEEELLLGYYYPDETNPQYQIIKVPGMKEKRVRLRFRKRTAKISSLFDYVPLRSRLAIISMLRALKAEEGGDFNAAGALEGAALKRLVEEQEANNPIRQASLQFDSGSLPGFNRNIS